MVFNHEFIHAYHFSLGLTNVNYSESAASSYSLAYSKVYNMSKINMINFRKMIKPFPKGYSWSNLQHIIKLGIK